MASSIFWACDAKNYYPLRAFPYLTEEDTGVRPGHRNVGLAAVIVHTLTKDLGTGSNVSCHN